MIVLAWLWERRAGVAAGLAVGIVLGALIAHFRKSEPPTVHLEEEDHSKSSDTAKIDQKTTQGARDIDWTLYAGLNNVPATAMPAGTPRMPTLPGRAGVPVPPAGLGGCAIIATVHEHDGPTVISTHETERQVETVDRHIDLTVQPAEEKYALGAGFKLNTDVSLVLAGGLRLPDLPLLGKVWLETVIKPDLAQPLHSEVIVFAAKHF